MPRDESVADRFSWSSSASGSYSAKLVYDRLCIGLVRFPFSSCIWRSWAPLNCKTFSWLAVQLRLWTSDRRAWHGLQDDPSACYTCLQDEDNADQILAQCLYAREVRHTSFDRCRINIHSPVSKDYFSTWWLQDRRRFGKADKRGFDSMVIAINWVLWKRRNARVFHRVDQQKTPSQLVNLIFQDLAIWKLAGAGGLQRFLKD